MNCYLPFVVGVFVCACVSVSLGVYFVCVCLWSTILHHNSIEFRCVHMRQCDRCGFLFTCFFCLLVCFLFIVGRCSAHTYNAKIINVFILLMWMYLCPQWNKLSIDDDDLRKISHVHKKRREELLRFFFAVWLRQINEEQKKWTANEEQESRIRHTQSRNTVFFSGNTIKRRQQQHKIEKFAENMLKFYGSRVWYPVSVSVSVSVYVYCTYVKPKKFIYKFFFTSRSSFYFYFSCWFFYSSLNCHCHLGIILSVLFIQRSIYASMYRNIYYFYYIFLLMIRHDTHYTIRYVVSGMPCMRLTIMLI